MKALQTVSVYAPDGDLKPLALGDLGPERLDGDPVRGELRPGELFLCGELRRGGVELRWRSLREPFGELPRLGVLPRLGELLLCGELPLC